MIPFIATAILMTVIFIFGLMAFLITFHKKQNRKSREYLTAILEEQDRTMSIISLEVHDNVNQMLNIVRMNLHWLARATVDEYPAIVKQTGDIVDTLIMDTNNIGHTLNNEYLQSKGLINSLKEEVLWVSNSKKLFCKLHISGITRKIVPQTELMIFRIAQEAINNTVKHAMADEINIHLDYSRNAIALRIIDDGKGFDFSSGTFEHNVGMLSMSRRAKLIDGTLVIKSTLGKGTEVALEVACT